MTRKAKWQKEREAQIKAQEELLKKQAACKHPLSSASASTDTIMNCPAEGWPDEEVAAIRCGECEATLVMKTDGVIGFLLEHVKRLSAELAEIKKGPVA